MTMSVYNAFATLENPRQAHTKVKHRFQGVIVLSIITQIEAFGQANYVLALKFWNMGVEVRGSP
jgi:hypothetical protein